MGQKPLTRGVACVALGLTMACGGATEPESLPKLGRYAYSLAVPVNTTSLNLRTFSGTLVLTYITKDSLAGTWQVPASSYASGATGPGMQARLTLGFFNGGGWFFFGYPTDGGTLQHRLFPGKALRCDGAALYSDGIGGVVRREGTCALAYLGP